MSRPSFDEVYLHMAKVLSTRAACTRSQVGALVVKDTFIVGAGYNGVASGLLHCTDGGCERGKLTYAEKPPLGSYADCPAIHAENNAVMRAGEAASGSVVYVTREPCSDCYGILAAANVIRVVWGLEFDYERRLFDDLIWG